MENFIDYITISNFKSIRELKLEGLSRINLFIGKPNVGKSNILEALGVFSLPHLELNSNKRLSTFVRIENQNEIFFDGNFENQISINSNISNCRITKNPEYVNPNTGVVENSNYNVFEISIDNSEFEAYYYFDSKPGLNLGGLSRPWKKEISKPVIVKYYNYLKGIKTKSQSLNYLIPPHGTNLMQMVENNRLLKRDIIHLFKEYNLELVFDRSSQELKITKPPRNGEIFLIPYNSIADTLQRIIFYKTAIASNQNSVLIFEEPEAHAFPAYISHITHEIINSKSNQFILSTHSPYVLNDFLENARDELSIFMVDYKNGETVANKLTKEEIEEIYQYGIDLFTNYETYLK